MAFARFRTTPPPAPTWGRDGDREVLSFSAVPARLGVFAATIAAVTLGGGVLVSVLAIMLTPDSARAARILIVAAALCLCLPLVFLVMAPFRARTRAVTLSHDGDALALTVGGESRRIPLRENESLVWRTGTEYARIVVEAPGSRCSLLVGVARPTPGHRADLPEISQGLHHALTATGLSPTTTRPGNTRYRR